MSGFDRGEEEQETLVTSLTTKKKTEIVSRLKSRYSLNTLLQRVMLARATFYDRLKRNQKPDKYAKVKAFIKDESIKSRETYGYRRMHDLTTAAGFPYSEETIRRLMKSMGLQVTIYSKRTAKYRSYKGTIGAIAPNILQQKFTAKVPFRVLHTDIAQIKLRNGTRGYISAIIDQASREILSLVASVSPNMALIKKTLAQLKLPRDHAEVILHSDQGWQYQWPAYQQQLCDMNITQSMSRKGNCHDNAPMESFFGLLRRECLNRQHIRDINELNEVLADYARWFNNERISRNKNGLTPVAYRNQAKIA
ncbi:IS3 family transposase [Lacticaseibacillus saniviri]